MTLSLKEIFSKKTQIRLIIVWLITGIFTFFGANFFNADMSTIIAVTGFVILLFAIIYAAFGVVSEADELAQKLGEPYGTLILTLSVVAIEVILISAVLMGPGENPTIGKDSIFSVMMIIMNLIIGLCLLFGGLKFKEQEYNSQGSLSYISMIVLLGGIGMILPNYISGNGVFSVTQTLVISALVIILYALFLFFQMKTYRYMYIQPQTGSTEINYEDFQKQQNILATKGAGSDNKSKEIWIRSIILLACLLPIVILSKHLAVVVDYGISAAQLPQVLGGIVIAIIVFTPESITAIKAALNNEMQRAVNLCHGAYVSTVAISIPAVLIVGLIAGKTVEFGLSTLELCFFMLTVLMSLLTFNGKRTTPMLGIMHLVLFAMFLLLIFVP